MNRSFSLLRFLRYTAPSRPLNTLGIPKVAVTLRASNESFVLERHYSTDPASVYQLGKLSLNIPHGAIEDREKISPTLSEKSEDEWMELGDLEVETEVQDEFKGISLKRGVTGVFDIEELVHLLHREHLNDIATIAIPSELNFVDYMVITTGRSAKQMEAVAEFIRKVFKRRALPSDPLPVIEGKNNKDWIAMDLGNIALHIFSRTTRETYDLETLWTCGAKYDDLSQETDNPFATFKPELPNFETTHQNM